MKKILTILLVLMAASAAQALADSITGIVVAEVDSAPIQGLWISAYHYQTYQNAGSALTNSQGVYTIANLTSGTYRIVFWGDNLYAQQCYNNVHNWDYATPVSVSGGGTTDNINLTLTLAGSITGTVRDANSNPIPDIMINAHCDALSYGRADYTDVNGVYELTGLPTGSYRVELATWNASSDDYIKQYYDHTIYWDQATLVGVLPGQQVAGIDFDLTEAASLSGYVKDPNGIGVEDTEVVSFFGHEWFTSTFTDANGFYSIGNLMAGITYKIAAYPPDSTDYMITRIFVNIPDINSYIAPDINLQDDALTVSGRVTDKTTSLPVTGMWVSCHFDDLDLWGGRAQTDANGQYALTNLMPGEYLGIQTEPPSQYARIGTEIELVQDIDNMDFALPPGATLSGRVIDAVTAEPIANIRIEYGSEKYNCWMNSSTDAQGLFNLTSLPDGIAEVMARPPASTGYAWSLPWGSNWIWLEEGRHKAERFIALQKGALAKGNVKYADNSPAAYIEVFYEGSMTEGWLDTDANGHYEIILPLGKYVVAVEYDEDELSSLPIYVTVADTNQTIILGDLTAYDDDSGETISGTISSAIGSPAPGEFWIAAVPAGTNLDPNNLRAIAFPGSECDLDGPGPFEITALPPDANYDICLFVGRENADEIESIALRDIAANIMPGANDIDLSLDSYGATVTGSVINACGDPVLGATIMLNDANTGVFGALADANENGQYIIYNVAPGTYTATAIHCKYQNASITVNIIEGATVDAGAIVIPFAGEKEAANLNGDGIVNMLDFAELASQFQQAGEFDADFNQDGNVTFADLERFVQSWLWQPIWYNP